jgi:uncharacterized protein (DUF2235 family)
MGKNIVVFCDGTNQKGGVGSNTNVYKLFNMIEDRTNRQIAYYDPGLGTDIRKVTGSLFGRGFSKNILECYQFIFENFEAGDKIYLFGFSRGAATVRSLSSFIHLFGILPKSRADLIKEAFSIYKKKNRKEKAATFINKHHTMWCTIEFVGVWDTVAALGMPSKGLSLILDSFFSHKFHSFNLSESVKFARQALAIDEERKTFHPVLWSPISNNSTVDKLKQVWFSGVHTDVGGGYKEDDLSDISLKWMTREAIDKGLIIYVKSQSYKSLINSSPDINGMMHDEQKGFIGKIFKRAKRTWNTETQGELHIHESVLCRSRNNENNEEPAYNPWIIEHIDSNNPKIEN